MLFISEKSLTQVFIITTVNVLKKEKGLFIFNNNKKSIKKDVTKLKK